VTWEEAFRGRCHVYLPSGHVQDERAPRELSWFGGIVEIDKDEQLDRALMRVDPARKWFLEPDLIKGLVTELEASEVGLPPVLLTP
jgi:hypothetical protein